MSSYFIKDDQQRAYVQSLVDRGYNVQLGPNDEILFATYWHPEIIVTKLFEKIK